MNNVRALQQISIFTVINNEFEIIFYESNHDDSENVEARNESGNDSKINTDDSYLFLRNVKIG